MARLFYLPNLSLTRNGGERGLVRAIERSNIKVSVVSLLRFNNDLNSWQALQSLSKLVKGGKGKVVLPGNPAQWLGIYVSRDLVEWLLANSLHKCKEQVYEYLVAGSLITGEPLSDLLENKAKMITERDPDLLKMAGFFNNFDPSGELLADKLFKRYRKEHNPPKFLNRWVPDGVSFEGRLVVVDEAGGYNPEEFKIWKRAFRKKERIVGYKRRSAKLSPTQERANLSPEIVNEIEALLPTAGILHIVRSGRTRKYKLLWVSHKQNVEKLLDQLQEGNPETLKSVGHFKSTSRKVGSVISAVLGIKAHAGNWVTMKVADVKNLLSQNWRAEHSVF